MIWLDVLIALVVLVWVITRFTGFKLPVDLRDKAARDEEFRKLFGRARLGEARDPEKDDRRVALQNDLQDMHEDVDVQMEPQVETKNVVRGRGKAKVVSGLDEIRQRDRSFDEGKFLAGVEKAVEYFYESWNAKDVQALDELCGPQLLAQITTGWEEQDTWELIVLEAIDKVSIVDARVHGRSAVIQVDLKLRLREGKRSVVRNVSKVWVLARAMNASDPNWELQEIKTVADA